MLYFSANNSACYKLCYNNWARWEGNLGRILILPNDFCTVEPLNNGYLRDKGKWPLQRGGRYREVPCRGVTRHLLFSRGWNIFIFKNLEKKCKVLFKCMTKSWLNTFCIKNHTSTKIFYKAILFVVALRVICSSDLTREPRQKNVINTTDHDKSQWV